MAPQSLAGRVLAVLGERLDEIVLRAIFGGLIVATVFVVGYDVYERSQASALQTAEKLLPGEKSRVEPFLPSVRPDVKKPGKTSKTASQELREDMKIELAPGGRLEATGMITPGTAERFQAELERRGDYVKTVVLDSPGGSVQDAIAMSKLIREKGYATRVEPDGHCASSCPLVFSGGVARSAGAGATIGVHQVISYGAPGRAEGAVQDDVQRISAECQRLLVDMGVDPRVWVHAMETSPQELFYFTEQELAELKLTTPAKVPVAAKPVG